MSSTDQLPLIYHPSARRALYIFPRGLNSHGAVYRTWEAGGYADIILRVSVHFTLTMDTGTSFYQVPLSSGSNAFYSQAANDLPLDSIDIVLIPYRSGAGIAVSTDLNLTLVSREHVGEVGILRYRWPVPMCIRPGRHEVRSFACLNRRVCSP